MMRNVFLSVVCCGVLLVSASTHADIMGARRATFKTVKEYDPSRQINTVDKSAAFDVLNSSGVGKDEMLVVGVNDFSDMLAQAVVNNFGGVVNFDNDEIPSEHAATSFVAYMGLKSLRITVEDAICNDFYTQYCTPISGPGYIGGAGFLSKPYTKDGSLPESKNFLFSWKESGFAAGEHVRAVAGTILGITGNVEGEDPWVMKAELDNGDMIAAAAPVRVDDGNKTDDTFFGVYAPEGRYIVGVSWETSSATAITNSVQCGFDDLAFITSKRSFVIAKNDELYAPPPTQTFTNSEGVVVLVDTSSQGSDGGSLSDLFGSDRPATNSNQVISSSIDPDEPIIEPSDVDSPSSTNTDYSALFGSDRVGGFSTRTNRITPAQSDAEDVDDISDEDYADDEEVDYSSLFGSDTPQR